MRALVVLLLAAAVASPGAAAAASSLTLAAPDGAVDSGSVVPVAVRVELRDFWCTQAREFGVEALVRGTGAQASLPNGSLRFVTDDEPHFADAFTVEGTLGVAVEALGATDGTVEIVASLAPPQDCFAPDGFPPASATLTLTVRPAPPPAPVEEAPANESAPGEANETPATNESLPANESDEAPQESVGRPAPGEGYIGDYTPPENERAVPGAGVAAVVLVAALAAGARRKR